MTGGTKYGTWVIGIALGLVFGWLLFDSLMVALVFGVCIGIAFALALGATTRDRRRAGPPDG